MKLYDFSLAPSPRRVRMFIAEKGIEIPSVQVNIREREQLTDDYRAVNPNCVVPTLELDDGTCLGESVAICRYLEETHPEPPLMGRDAREKAVIEMWSRQAEFDGYLAAAEAVRNSAPMFEDRGLPGVPGGVPQIPALIERGRQTMGRLFPKLDRQLAANRYLAGDTFSIADITAYVAIDFAGRAEIEIPADCPDLARWFGEVGKRPSAAA
ncbi:MAG: glutathione S-transferase family protein [Gammaproteobacteria bacterium]|nr:glutathione S-transferase family protein [Gammaproteobacteria bacterium]